MLQNRELTLWSRFYWFHDSGGSIILKTERLKFEAYQSSFAVLYSRRHKFQIYAHIPNTGKQMTNSPSVPGKTKHKYVLWGVLSQAFLKRTIHWSIPSLLLLIPHQMPQPNALYSYLKRHYRQNYFKSSKTALQIFYFCTELHYILPLRKLQQSSFYNISYLSDFICLEQI